MKPRLSHENFLHYISGVIFQIYSAKLIDTLYILGSNLGLGDFNATDLFDIIQISIRFAVTIRLL